MSPTKYLAIAAVAARHTLAARGQAVARVLFYLVLLLIFSRLWAVLATSGQISGLTAVAFTWYLALTEWAVLSLPNLYLSIEEDVRSGDIAYRVARPMSYVGMKLAEGAGDAAVRLLWIGVFGLGAVWWLVGALPADPRGLLLAAPLVVASVGVMLLFQVAIGLSTFWLQDASPLFWIWQKLMFVFGGLMFPLAIYPGALRAVCMWTPFEPLVHGCGRMALVYDPALAALTLGKTLAWGAGVALFVAWLFGRAMRRLDVGGG